jgi:predicted hydrolase (HD superfamily)
VGESKEHPLRGAQILKEHGFPDHVVHAVLSHGDDTGVSRKTQMEKALFAVDELTGFVIAVALVRPSKSLSDLEPSSVKKKMKDKAFAKAVKREDLARGAEGLGISLDEHIANVIEGLKPVAAHLGLSAGV